MTDGIQRDWLPLFTWSKFFYDKQKEFITSKSWQAWLIAANGTGKTLTFYWSLVAYMLGVHPKQIAKPPIKCRVLVPSYDNVKDVALEKLQYPQRIEFKELNPKQRKWIEFLGECDAILSYKEPKRTNGYLEIGPILPESSIKKNKGFKKEHRGIELTNGSSIWWVTSEQGWELQRGGEHDIVGADEEPDERVMDEVVRGLRNAKGGGKILGAMTPPYNPGQGPTWTKERVLDASVEDEDIHVINACMADNPAITPEFIKRFSQGKTKKQIDVQIYGKYPTWGDLVHPDFQDFEWDPKEIKGHLLRNDVELPDVHDVDWVMAFDWHQSKPCAAVFGYIDRVNGNITFFDELDRDLAEGKTIDDLADIFRNIEGFPHYNRDFRRWQDPSAKHSYHAVQRGFNAWDAFRKAGIVTSSGKNRDPDVGISMVNEYFRGNGRDKPRVFIYERCKYLRQYLVNHYYKRGEDGKGKPDPRWSDYPICIRYILQEVGQKKVAGGRKKWPLQSFQKQQRNYSIQLNA